jgi:hypothetical protein
VEGAFVFFAVGATVFVVGSFFEGAVSDFPVSATEAVSVEVLARFAFSFSDTCIRVTLK